LGRQFFSYPELKGDLFKSMTERPSGPSAAVWLIDLTHLDASRLEHCCKILGPAESARLARFIRPQRRMQYVLGRMLLRHAVSHFTGLPATGITVFEREGNSPLVKLPSPYVAPSFSISHSAGWIACAASCDAPLGLDIEVVERGRDVSSIAEVAFSPHEQQYVLEAEGDERLARFYRVWTTKEALFKLEYSQAGRAALPDVASDCGMIAEGESWWSTVLVHPQLCITLCATLPLNDVQLHTVSPRQFSC
jgi:4'-phosphopantetheinyl transferase